MIVILSAAKDLTSAYGLSLKTMQHSREKQAS